MFGQYFNQTDKTLEFVLYDKQKHVKTIRTLNKDDYLTEIPISVCQYNLGNINYKNQIDMTGVSGYVPAINVDSLDLIADFQSYKNNILNKDIKQIQDYLGKTITGNINIIDFITQEIPIGITPFVGTIYNQDIPIITGSWNNAFISGKISGDFLETNLKLENIYWYNDNLQSDIISGIIESQNISAEIIKPQLYLNNTSGILTGQPENIWRLNSDYINVNIGYEAFNLTCPDLIPSDYLNNTADNYYIGVIKFTCPFYTAKVSNTKDTYITGFKSIKCTYETQSVSLFNDGDIINDNIGLILLSKQYPKCELNRDHDLEISTIITTLGGNKAKNYLATSDNIEDLYTNIYANNELELLKNSIASTSGDAISKLTGLILTGTIIDSNSNIIPLSTGIDLLNYEILNNTASISSELNWFNSDWGFDFYNNGFIQYITNQDLSVLPQYNASINTRIK